MVSVTHQDTGVSGYVMTRYVTLHNLPSKPTRKVSHPAGSYVNLRSAPNMYANNILVRVDSTDESDIALQIVELEINLLVDSFWDRFRSTSQNMEMELRNAFRQ